MNTAQAALPSAMAETLDKNRALKGLGAHDWALDSIALSKKQAYSGHVQMRRASYESACWS